MEVTAVLTMVIIDVNDGSCRPTTVVPVTVMMATCYSGYIILDSVLIFVRVWVTTGSVRS
ncbi:hypothetical protein Hdeb2414_s0015g00445181 [Helianthus debilis subsp. tardiflorus]